jgi:hypothetical protein
MILSAKPPISPIATSSLMNEVIQELAQDQNLIRIKKLLLFVCTQNWESNPQRLEQADLQELLQRLMAIAPTLEQLQSQLHSIARSLNKSAEYSLVANAIINRISRLYLETQPTHRVGTRQRDYETVAQQLSCYSDLSRVKKLLLLASRNVWQTQPEQLNQISLLDLVQEVHSLTPTLESLRAVLENLVKTLSKPIEYADVAERISLAFQPLYLVKFSLPIPAALASDATAAMEVAPLTEAGDATEGLPATATPSVIRSQLRLQSTGQSAGQFTGQPMSYAATPPELGDVQQGNLSDLFDLRLDLMRLANPFKIKILLFSVLHETFQPGHEQMLKNHELDDLLRILLQTHKLLNELESKLFSAARLLPDPTDYFQVAQVVLQTTRSFYTSPIATPPTPSVPDLSAAAADNLVSDRATGIVSIEASLAGTTEPGANQPNELAFSEHTCQILPFKAPC